MLKAAAAGQQPPVLEAPHRLPDPELAHPSPHHARSCRDADLFLSAGWLAIKILQARRSLSGRAAIGATIKGAAKRSLPTIAWEAPDARSPNLRTGPGHGRSSL